MLFHPKKWISFGLLKNHPSLIQEVESLPRWWEKSLENILQKGSEKYFPMIVS